MVVLVDVFVDVTEPAAAWTVLGLDPILRHNRAGGADLERAHVVPAACRPRPAVAIHADVESIEIHECLVSRICNGRVDRRAPW